MIRKVTDLRIADWQSFIDEYKREPPVKSDGTPIAMRIDGTILSTMRLFGGGTYNGRKYTTFEDKSVPGEFTCEFATIAVRDDFLKWVKKQLKDNSAKPEDNADGNC